MSRCVRSMRLLRPPWLCVRWAAEGWRVEINVKFKEPAVYVWGEMKVGEAPALGLWTGLSRCMCVCVCTPASRWGYWESPGGILRQVSSSTEFISL